VGGGLGVLFFVDWQNGLFVSANRKRSGDTMKKGWVGEGG